MRGLPTNDDSLRADGAGHRWEAPLEWVQLACLAWVVWLPVSMGFVLYPALLLVFLTSAALLVLRGARPTRGVLLAWGAYFAWAVVVAVVSRLQGNPGVVHQAALWLGLPVLWGTWAYSLRGTQVRRTLAVLLGVGSLGALLVTWLGVSQAWDLPGLPGFLVTLQDTRVTMAPSGEIELNYLGLSSLVGTGALAVAAALLPGREAWLPARPYVAAAAALHLVAAGVAGRRGLLLALLAVLAVAAVAGLVMHLRSSRASRGALSHVGVVLGTGVALVAFAYTPVGANVHSLLAQVSSMAGVAIPDAPVAGTDPGGAAPDDGPSTPDAFDDLQAESDSLRGEQFHELISGWQDSPVVGQGYGATLDSDFVRSETRPWMFETEPLQVLMSTGLLGILVLLLALALLLRSAFTALRRGSHPRVVISSLAVLGSVVLACATNPYLQAPGHGWMLFLAAGVCHAALLASGTGDPSGAESAAVHEPAQRH